MDPFAILLGKRRSIREFLDRDVPLEIVKNIVRDTCMAPSAMNGQPWRFSIATNRERIRALSDESKRNFLVDLKANPDSPLGRYEAILKDPGFDVFYHAPCVVYISGPRDVGSLELDCALAASYFMFAAAVRDLGTCWVGLGANLRDTSLLKGLGISPDLRIVAPIALGYPKEIPPPPERNEPVILSVLE